MNLLAGAGGLWLIGITLWEAFETIILPRRVTRQIRLTRLFYRLSWAPVSALARRMTNSRRENLVSYFGPLSLLVLIALWAGSLIIGFALLDWALRPAGSSADLRTYLFISAATFFSSNLATGVSNTSLLRFPLIAEAGVGFGFLALIISYLPALNSAFSRREVNVSILDERAGSPPVAFELLRRYQAAGELAGVTGFLQNWERWSAELMESHLSYPVLAFFRSQHENQSWVTALTMVLDLSALALVGIDGLPTEAARLSFAMARHAAVDLTQVFNTPPRPLKADRLPPAALERLRAGCVQAGIALRAGPEADRQLNELRQMYEPYMNALADLLLVALPPWIPPEEGRDNWQTTAWEA